MHLILGIDLACRAAHQPSLARADGSYVWTGRKFFTRTTDLERLWSAQDLRDDDTVQVVLEPTRNVWRPWRPGCADAAPGGSPCRWCPPASPLTCAPTTPSTPIDDLDERIANLYTDTNPDGIILSAPGLGPITAPVVAGRLGDPHRFHSLAAVRAYSGLIPKLAQPGQGQHQHGLTKAGDALLRETLFTAADQARRRDPQLSANTARSAQSMQGLGLNLRSTATSWRRTSSSMPLDEVARPSSASQLRSPMRIR